MHYPFTSSSPLSNDVMASPIITTTARFNNGEHQLLNQMQYHQSPQQQHQQRHQRLPPDLLPYGQHQSLAQKNSLNSSGSSGSSSGGSTVIIDHRTQTYSSNSSNSNNKYETYVDDDGCIDDMENIGNNENDNDDGDNDSGKLLFLSEKHLIRRPSDERDLRIYHHDIVGGIGIGSSASNSMKLTTSQKSFGLLGASCTTTTTMTIASGKTTTLLPSHRFKNNYELSSMSSSPPSLTSSSTTTTMPNKHNLYPFYNPNPMASSQQSIVASTHSNLKLTSESVSVASTANCKPRQSIVRTSPSFSFLSNGYHQQHDNFL